MATKKAAPVAKRGRPAKAAPAPAKRGRPAKAAAAPAKRGRPAKAAPAPAKANDYNPLSLSDEEFSKLGNPKFL